MIKFVLDGKMDCSILAYKADVPLPRVPFPLLVRQESPTSPFRSSAG